MNMETSASSNASPGTSCATKCPPRLRNLWTRSEDEILMRGAAMLLDQDGVTNAWSQIAESLPRRTNKDCRKRWMKICKKVNKGAWTGAEDMRLVKGVQQHGQCWIQVAQVVQTRHADQCAKRWQQSLDPSIIPARWLPRDDETLLAAVKVHGRKWKTIADEYFPSRSTTDIKNRYSFLTRERASSARNDDPSIRDDVISELRPEMDLESIDSLSDTDLSVTTDKVDAADAEDMPDAEMSVPVDAHLATTPTTIDWNTSLYTAACDYTFIDHDPDLTLNLTPPVDTDASIADKMPWNAPILTPLDANTGHLGLLPYILNLKQGDDCRIQASDSSMPESSLRRPRSTTTLVLEDVDPATLCKVIGVLAEARTKISMQSGEND